MSTTITTAFVECVSCGDHAEVGFHDGSTLAITDGEAADLAKAKGWTVKGYNGGKATRCPKCRKARRRDTRALDAGKLGRRAGWQTTGRAPHPRGRRG